jgi:hypothetical protein
MSRTYCHTHSAYDCQTCADEILSLGIQVDKDRIKWLESEVARLEACAARTVPDGFVVVPVEPTTEMLKAGERGIGVSSYVRKGMTIREYCFFKSGWDAMLSAAPEVKK